MVNLNLSGVPIEFPFQPYDVQEKFMESVLQCLQQVGKTYDLFILNSWTVDLIPLSQGCKWLVGIANWNRKNIVPFVFYFGLAGH